jgi:hypothetical protein
MYFIALCMTLNSRLVAHAKQWLPEVYAPVIHARRKEGKEERRAERARLLEWLDRDLKK